MIIGKSQNGATIQPWLQAEMDKDYHPDSTNFEVLSPKSAESNSAKYDLRTDVGEQLIMDGDGAFITVPSSGPKDLSQLTSRPRLHQGKKEQLRLAP